MIEPNANTAYSGALSVGNLNKTGAGNLALNGLLPVSTLTLNNTSGGTLSLNGGANVNIINSQAGNLTVNTGTLNLNQTTTGAAALSAGSTTTPGTLPATTPGTFTVNNGTVVNVLTNTGFAYVDGSGGSKITVDGAGSALNTKIFYAGTQYSGGLTVQNGGLVSASGYAVLGDQGTGTARVLSGGVFQVSVTGSLSIGANGGTGALTVDGAGSKLSAGSGTVMLGNGSLTAQNGGLLQSSNAIVGGRDGFTGTAIVTGTGSLWTTANLVLGGDAAGAGTSSGTGLLTIANGGAVQVTGKMGFYTPNSSLTVNGGSLSTSTLVSSSGNGSINLVANQAAASTIAVTGGSASTYSGTINGNGSLTLSGGQQTLSGNISGAGGPTVGAGQHTISGTNSFTGATTINGGTLTLGNSLALQNSAVTVNVAGGLNVNGLSSVSVGGISGSVSTINLGGAALVINGAAGTNSVYNGQLQNISSLTMNSGAQTLNSAFALFGFCSNAGAVTINGGVLTIGDANALYGASSVKVNSANGLNLNVLQSASLTNLSGSGALNLGPTTLSLFESQNLTYSGAISGTGTIYANGQGTLTLTGANTYTGTAEGYSISQLGGGAYISPGNGFGSFTAVYGGTINYGFSTINGGFISGNGHQIAGDAAGITTFNGTTINADATLTFIGQTAMNNVTDNGKLVISDPNVNVKLTYGKIGASGELDVNAFLSVADLQSAGVIKVGSGVTLLAGPAINSGNPGVETLVLAAGSRTYVGTPDLQGGTITLTNQNRIELSGLLVNNETINGGVDVNYGGLLEGAGLITGTVNVGSGGTVHAGNSTGTLTTGGAIWGSGGIYEFDIANAAGSAGSDWSFWNMTGDLNITAGNTPNSKFTIDITSLLSNGALGQASNFDKLQNYHWLLASATSISGFSASNFSLLSRNFQNPTVDGGSFQIIQQGNDLFLVFSPEPGTVGMMLASIGALAALARRKQRNINQ